MLEHFLTLEEVQGKTFQYLGKYRERLVVGYDYTGRSTTKKIWLRLVPKGEEKAVLHGIVNSEPTDGEKKKSPIKEIEEEYLPLFRTKEEI